MSDQGTAYAGPESETFRLDLDSVCVLAASMAQSLESMNSNSDLLAFLHSRGGDVDSLITEHNAMVQRYQGAARQLIAIHDAMHEGKNVQVCVVPF